MNSMEIFRQLTFIPVLYLSEFLCKIDHFSWADCRIICNREGTQGADTAMSTIKEVRDAEEKIKTVLDALKTTKAEEPNYLDTELKCANDEYTRAVRELEWT